MPFKSKAQMRYFFAAESQGKLPTGTARTWAHHTRNLKKLPQHVKQTVKKTVKSAGLSGGLMSLKIMGNHNQLTGSSALGFQGGELGPGPLPSGVKPTAVTKGPLTNSNSALYGLRKSPVPGRALPPTVGNMNGQLRAN